MKGVIDRSSLCDRCHNGQVMQCTGDRRFVICRDLARMVPPDVQSCSQYQPVGQGMLGKYENTQAGHSGMVIRVPDDTKYKGVKEGDGGTYL
jgi:hypothetical protein